MELNNTSFPDVFTEIKNAVDIKTVAEHYGIKIKHNKALCPFHPDKDTPSLSFKNESYHCFGCGVGGDVINLVARLHGTRQKEAAQIINDTFNLGLNLDRRITRTEIARERQKDILLKSYKRWERNALQSLTELFKRYRECMRKEPPFSDKWAEVAERLPVIEYKLDLLLSDDTKSKIQWFKEDLRKAGDKNEYRQRA